MNNDSEISELAKSTLIKDLHKKTSDYLNKEVVVRGWLRTARGSKELAFLELNDASFFKGLQVVLESSLSNFAEFENAPIGSSIEVRGNLQESQGAGQSFELLAKEIKFIAKADADYPLQKKRHSFEFLREIAHLRPRSNTFSAVFRLRSVLSFAIHKFFQAEGFSYVHTPIISTSDCEGAGEMFQVTTLDLKKPALNQRGEPDFKKDFFARQVGLTVSGQLNAEALIMGLNKVYTFGPTFRAENSNTSRHISEFWMIEPEMAFANLKDNLDISEKMLKYLAKEVLDNLKEEVDFFSKFIKAGLRETLENILSQDFARISYTEAIEILEKSGEKFDQAVFWGIDLQSEHERYLAEKVFKGPVFLTDYPKDIKAFYMRLNDDKKTVAAMDLLVPEIGELIGGSQREERYDLLEQRILESKMDLAEYQWYLDLRRYGSIKHAGFGLGFERLLMYFSGISNIRDVIPFPRAPKQAKF